MPEKIAILICAFNEEKNLPKLLRSLKRWKQIDPTNRTILVVNDGSVDGTKNVALKSACKVIDSSATRKNIGKGGAFVTGVKHIMTKIKPDFIVTLDADLVTIKSRNIDSLIKPLKSTRANMVIGKNREYYKDNNGLSPGEYAFSGQRAIRATTLHPILVRKQKWLSQLQGYGLEHALNRLIPRIVYSKTAFYALPAFKNGLYLKQREDIKKSEERANQRIIKAWKLKLKRRGRFIRKR